MTQYVVWVTAITVHAGPRFLFISIYYRYYLKMIKHQKQYLAKVACSLNVIENISLLGLTYLSSSGSYGMFIFVCFDYHNYSIIERYHLFGSIIKYLIMI